MNKTYYMPLLISVIGALLLSVFGTIRQDTILFAFAMATLSVGFGIGSLMLALHTERRMTEMGAALARIEGLQEEIQKEQNERASSGPPIIASLQAMSQYYMDYINKQKGEDKK